MFCFENLVKDKVSHKSGKIEEMLCKAWQNFWDLETGVIATDKLLLHDIFTTVSSSKIDGMLS